jgi:hypothetical protein
MTATSRTTCRDSTERSDLGRHLTEPEEAEGGAQERAALRVRYATVVFHF